MELKEKILLLGSLFHDIGKFEQRCTNKKVKHEELGYSLITEFEESFTKILGGKESFNIMRDIISGHHDRENKNELVIITKTSDYLSASERVEFSEPNADLSEKWSHKFLSSLFSKIFLNNKNGKQLRYYEQRLLTEKNHRVLIPEFDNEDDVKSNGYKLDYKHLENFKDQLKAVLAYFRSDEDFGTIINLLLILLEKYMWSIPDFIGSDNTDISLYNHSKDVAGLAHAIYKSKLSSSTKLNLIIGDIPGIQKYIFNVANKKPAKVLRGRSIYVQILTRQFASIMLNELGYSDANLIMLAGGKFYIMADNSDSFKQNYNNAKEKINNHLIENFHFQLSFSSAYETFDYESLKSKNKDEKTTFGELIDRASYKLLEKRNQQFYSHLINNNQFDENNFVMESKYIEPDESADSNKIKCAVTDIPIRKGRKGNIEDEQVDKQVENEFKIGEKITKGNVVVEFTNDFATVLKVHTLKDYVKNDAANKILINPALDELLKEENLEKDILKKALIVEVANYASKNAENEKLVMDFGEMENLNTGAKFMTLIKGDIDNLGLIMSSGLVDDENDYTGISRTTTLSNHLKYFFSYSLNGFLEDWENGKIIKSVDDRETLDQKIYTVFAGGDDLMLICPQSSSLKLLDAFNKTFNDFVCNNPEVHISYSLTNFKHNTPIRIVADMAEENQEKVKNELKSIYALSEVDTFEVQKDKAGFRLFDTNLKNDELEELLFKREMLIRNYNNNNLTTGIIRNLLQFSKMMRDFRENEETNSLVWYPLLSYLVNRRIKQEGDYPNSELKEFIDKILRIHKDVKSLKLEKSLYPLLNEVIYTIRN